MKELKLSNFKAFGDDEVHFGGVASDGRPMNILCYGENGAGKSSVFEAIKYVFHRQRIERERVPAHLSGPARDNAKQQIMIDYKNKASANPAKITVNGQPVSTFSATDYNVYMIESRNLVVNKQIDIKSMLESMYLGQHDIDREVSEEFFDMILGDVNRVLKSIFFEEIQLSRSQNGTFLVKIDDDKQNLHYDDDLRLHFNEAKLHLISLLLALSSISLMAPPETGCKKMLVLDDFITSLDTANRTFLYQYMTTCFTAYQIIIFTHNTSFYNLCDHFLNEDKDNNKYWLRQGIFEYNHKHYSYAKTGENRLVAIKKKLEESPDRLTDIGNEVRQYFEVLLHQLSLMIMAGAKEETSKILEEVTNKSSNRTFHIDENGIKDLGFLFESINKIMKNAPEDLQLEKIKKAINDFNDVDESVDKLSENLQAMTIYQKVALHQSSHGHEGLPDMSAKEIRASLCVLDELEKTIKKMKIERI